MKKNIDNFKWINAEELGIEGKGWSETKYFFDRLPVKAEGVVRDVVWELSRAAAGMTVHFKTDATEIRARWQLESPELSNSTMCATGRSGLDLYARDATNKWRWAGVSTEVNSQSPDNVLVADMDSAMRQYMLYLPLFNPVSKLEIGIPDCTFEAVSARRGKPIVFYGTSIVHGASASRPGMAHAAMLGRRLDTPVINLGFDGNALMESELADLLIELDPLMYVIDAVPNMNAQLIAERAEQFIRKIYTAKPGVPIILVEDRTYTNSWIIPYKQKENNTRRAEFRKVYRRLKADGILGLHYIEGANLIGPDDEASVCGSHPTDLGFFRIADTLEPVLKALL
jgi:GDSL-like Lipase/Acylhydrolase family/N-terminus of Esterase_SGNH_hydro-type